MRRKPYTVIGIKRIPCTRCGQPSHATWQICADGNQYRGLCKVCDVQLNDLVLYFMKIKDRQELMDKYMKKMETDNATLNI